MNKKINKIPEYLKIEKLKNDKRVVVYLVCVLIATVLWFLNALNKDYTTSISFPVKYTNPPAHRFLSNRPPSQVDLKVKAHGFTLLRYKLHMSFAPIILNLKSITKDVEPRNGHYRVASSKVLHRIRSQVSNEISILEVQPGIINIVLDSLKTKTVPVKADVDLDFVAQFSLKDTVLVIPASVEIVGPSAIVDTITCLFTGQKKYTKVDRTISRTLDIIHPENTTVKPEKVQVRIDVEEYTEKEIRIPLTIKNKPDSVKVKLFPSDVMLTCLAGLSKCDALTSSDFSVFVDYAQIKSNTNSLQVFVGKKSSYVQKV